MKNLKTTIFLLALILAVYSSNHATEVVIGAGTGDARPPFNIVYGYGRSLSLYTAEQIGTFGRISKLGWDAKRNYDFDVPYKIWAKTTNETSMVRMTWEAFTNGATELKADTYSFNRNGWHTFDLTTPFDYDGGNLLIGVETNHPTGNHSNYGGDGQSAWFGYTNFGTNTHQYWERIGAAPRGLGGLENKVPNIQITFSDPALSLTPAGFDFGSVPINTTVSQTFTMRNTGILAMNITGISPSFSGFFSITNTPTFPLTLAAGQTASFNIQYRPTEAGEHTGAFNIAFNKRATMNFAVKGNGEDPTLPVTLSHFSATLNAQNYVLLTWISQSESNIVGYNILRNSELELSSAVQVSPLIAGTNTSEPHTYSYCDEELAEQGTYYYWLQSVDMDGTVSFFGPVSVDFSLGGETVNPGVPLVNMLDNAYPNPFNPYTTLRYQIADPGNVKIDIYNSKGQMVRSFSDNRDAAGYYQIIWDGKDHSGRALPSGVYLCKMNSGGFSSTKKIVLAK